MSELLDFEFVRSFDRLLVLHVHPEQLSVAVSVELALVDGSLGNCECNSEHEDDEDRQNDEDRSSNEHECVVHNASLVGVIIGRVKYALRQTL